MGLVITMNAKHGFGGTPVKSPAKNAFSEQVALITAHLPFAPQPNTTSTPT